ncbi:hypothetical protein TNCV_2671771 [Trichonephila clavipes]|nr:hypothetical protein TNCV_2671771 [Trichonephila clavipes]
MPKLWRRISVVAPSIVKIYRLFENFYELNRTVTCMVLKAKDNDRRTSSPLPRRISYGIHNHWILRETPLLWPQRSLDLTSLGCLPVEQSSGIGVLRRRDNTSELTRLHAAYTSLNTAPAATCGLIHSTELSCLHRYARRTLRTSVFINICKYYC